MNTEQILDFANELDQQELATLRVAALLGNTFSLDYRFIERIQIQLDDIPYFSTKKRSVESLK